jgi:hypothetical protein
MQLIQILLPLYDNDGRRIGASLFKTTAEELTTRFGGVTAHTRAPVEGLWKRSGRRAVHDDLVIYEVVASRLQRRWWIAYRRELGRRFRQEQIFVRAMAIAQL